MMGVVAVFLRMRWPVLLLVCLMLASPLTRGQESALSSGQSLYLPIYSHLYHGDVHPKTGKPSETLVSTHVSIRNTDPVTAMKVTSARYYNTEGKLLREFMSKFQMIPPLGTYELYVPRSDSSGGSGANFLIDWVADKPINAPLVEALHADIREARTLLFVTTARPIHLR